MSDDSWPETGSGVSSFDPRVDGTPSKGPGVRSEPGRAQRSGSRRSHDMYTFWLDTMEPAVRGRAVMIFVDRPRFHANLKTIRKQLGPDEETARVNERIRGGIKSYAEDIRLGILSMEGKPAWPVFMRVWPKYVANATEAPATKDEIASGKRRWDE